LEKVPRPARAAETIAAATEQLEKLIPADGRKTVKIATAVRIGKAYEQIIQFAQESQIDLAIMGVRGRGGLDLAIFGRCQISERFLKYLPIRCDKQLRLSLYSPSEPKRWDSRCR
jgi:nucleotide-binding universal stress UspA family protein